MGDILRNDNWLQNNYGSGTLVFFLASFHFFTIEENLVWKYLSEACIKYYISWFQNISFCYFFLFVTKGC
jgi:hypothetical protein